VDRITAYLVTVLKRLKPFFDFFAVVGFLGFMTTWPLVDLSLGADTTTFPLLLAAIFYNM
jgi:hypothetical protein